MQVLIINGHPRKGSFAEAIVKAYAAGATAAGVHISKLTLYTLDFNLNVAESTPKKQLMEPDVLLAQLSIAKADHIVFVYPTWWGTMPALLKGFIDRVFTEGFAFNDIEGGTGYAPLLTGRTAQLITTMDTPSLVYRLIYRSPGHNAMKRATLQFCGFEMARTMRFGPVKASSPQQRAQWLAKAEREGKRLARGPLSPAKRFSISLMAWLKAIRLQFYPMTFIAYTVGAFAAEKNGYAFDRSTYILGYLWLFFLEVATVLINEYVDFATDKSNKYFSPFTGGSRVIVERHLTFKEVKTGIVLSLVLSVIFLIAVLMNMRAAVPATFAACIALTVLALGYTASPARLSYRGLGELTVGITHSVAVILCGYLFMGGAAGDAAPWLLSIPLFFSVLPSILLAGIPDRQADRAAGKKTIAVRFGARTAVVCALALTWTAPAAVAILLMISPQLSLAFRGVLFITVAHAWILTRSLMKLVRQPEIEGRIDSVLIAALTFIIWFGLIPLINMR